jgi:hypothetical protein
MLNIITPRTGNPTSFKELITDNPIVVKIYDISFRLKFLVLNLNIAKTANRPTAMPNSIKTDFSIEVMKKTVMPIRKKVNRNFSFLEYLK